MDGDDNPWVDQCSGLRGSSGVEMARAKCWAPPPDWEYCNIDGPQVGHVIKQIGIARVVDALPAKIDDKSHRFGTDATVWSTATFVLCVHYFNQCLADLDAVALVAFSNSTEACLYRQWAKSSRRNDVYVLSQLAQTADVEVVRVGMRQQHDVDVQRVYRGHWDAAAEVGHPLCKQRVGDDLKSIGLDQYRRVTDPREANGFHGHHAKLSCRLAVCIRRPLMPWPSANDDMVAEAGEDWHKNL